MPEATPSPEYRCPACGFLIHNRNYPKCERCQKELPADLLYSKEEKEKSWQDLMAVRAKETQAKAEAERERAYKPYHGRGAWL
jgi:DNA-directed RNA polymerase subunit RPC12/RpoP